jgi:hypothetical protein
VRRHVEANSRNIWQSKKLCQPPETKTDCVASKAQSSTSRNNTTLAQPDYQINHNAVMQATKHNPRASIADWSQILPSTIPHHVSSLAHTPGQPSLVSVTRDSTQPKTNNNPHPNNP